MKADERPEAAQRPVRGRHKRLEPARSLEEEIMAISRRCAALPRRTERTPEEIIGYDPHGLPG
jgi:antitoxin VapB